MDTGVRLPKKLAGQNIVSSYTLHRYHKGRTAPAKAKENDFAIITMQDNEDVNKGFASVGEREWRNLLEITEE